MVLVTSSKFCIPEQRLVKVWAYGTFQAWKSKQFADRKCQVRLNRSRISAPNDSGEGGGGKAGWGGGILKWSKGGLALSIPPAFYSCASAFAHSFEQLLKKIASWYIYVRQERLSSETNDRAPRTLKKKTHLWGKKKNKGKERKKRRKGRSH